MMPDFITIRVSFPHDADLKTLVQHTSAEICPNDFDAASLALYDIMERLDLQPQHPKLPKEPPDDPKTL